ncbi:MAG: hypothetical protein A4E36_00275 [Methanoregulaceae archaeon PtaB.Bin009]|nr:MAG: hypothetical protein A4E36_00275 [Methanoregulaceae archaeon PtaB.Bin009]
MSHNLPTKVIVPILLFSLLCTAVSAFNMDTVRYNMGVYNEQDDYSLAPATIIPQSSYPVVGSHELMVDDTTLTLNRYPLVASPGETVNIELTGFITDVPLPFASDLLYPQVSLNGQPVQGQALMGSGTIEVNGVVPPDAEINQPVSILSFPDATKETNAQFITYITTPEQAAAKESLFAVSEKDKTGLFGISRDDFRIAIDEFKKGNFAISTIRSEIALEKSDILTEGITLGILIGAVIAALLGIAAWYFGRRRGQEMVRRPDLLALEAVIIQYFDVKIQKKAEIQKWCRGMIEKAFEVNIRRSEIIADKSKSGVNPDDLTSKDLQPSLFQAFYEKHQFGHSRAFDIAIADLQQCLRSAGSRADGKDSQDSGTTLFGTR